MLTFQRQMILTLPNFAINGETKLRISGQRETNFEELASLGRGRSTRRQAGDSIQACYKLWRSCGAEFITEPKDHKFEFRC